MSALLDLGPPTLHGGAAYRDDAEDLKQNERKNSNGKSH